MSIQHTTNYNQFKLVQFNREKSAHHISQIKKKIKENNLLHLHPILVNLKGEVIDGQHRLQAAQELEVPIYYLKQ